MKDTGWKMVDSGPDTRIAEFKTDNPNDALVSYQEAKADALKRLKDHVAPYLARIEELEQDMFVEAGALPPLKAWKQEYSHSVITAKTKKRAMELAGESRYRFDSSWRECADDWWYHLAHEEAVWVEELDEQERGTGIFYKPLAREEAKQIIEPLLSPYRTMNIDELLALAGQTLTATGISSQGIPYKITTEVEQGTSVSSGQEVICVQIGIDADRGWMLPWVSVLRDLPERVVVGTEEWVKEGF